MKTMKSFTTITLGIVLLGTVFTSCSKEEGCTDPAANNFNVDAQTDDGSCTYDAVITPETVIKKSVLSINFSHNFDGLPVSSANFNQFNYVNQNGDTLNINRLRYLISDITLYKTNGDSVVFNGYKLVDLANNGSMNYLPGEADWGSYAAVGFTWGFDSLDNQQNYIDLNSANWNWPAMIGGGYHFMQLDGQFLQGGVAKPFNFHNGTASNMGNHEANHSYIKLPGIALNERNVSIEIKMNIAEMFRNPYTWDFNVYSTMLMPNYTAQKLIQKQMYSVFSYGSISQKQ